MALKSGTSRRTSTAYTGGSGGGSYVGDVSAGSLYAQSGGTRVTGPVPTAQDSAGNKPGELGYNPRTDPLSTSYVGDVTPGSQAYNIRAWAGWTGITTDNKLIAKTPEEVPAAAKPITPSPVYKISGKTVSKEEYAIKKGLARGQFEEQFISQKVLKGGRPREVKGVMTFEDKVLAARLIREREQAMALKTQLQAQPKIEPVKAVTTKEKISLGVKKPLSLKSLLISPYAFNIKDILKGTASLLVLEKQLQLKIGPKLKDIYEIPGKKAEVLRQPYETKEDLALKRKVEGLEYQTTTVRKRAAQRVKDQKRLEEDLRKYEENLRLAAESGDETKYNAALSLYNSKYQNYKTFVSQSQAKSTAEFGMIKGELEKFNVQFEEKPVKVNKYLSLIGITGTDINVKSLIERHAKTSEYEEKRAGRINVAMKKEEIEYIEKKTSPRFSEWIKKNTVYTSLPAGKRLLAMGLEVSPEFALGLLLPQEAALMYGRYAIGKLGYQAITKPKETLTGLYKTGKYSPERLIGPPLAFAGGILTRQYVLSKLSREELILKNFEEKISKDAVKTQDLNLGKLLRDMRQKDYFLEYAPPPIKVSELLKERFVKIPGVEEVLRKATGIVRRVSGETRAGFTEGFKERLKEPVVTERTPAVIKKAEVDLYRSYSPARMDWLTRFGERKFKVFVSVKDLERIGGFYAQRSLRGRGEEFGQVFFPFGKPRMIEAAKLEPYDILKLTGSLKREFSFTELPIKKLTSRVKPLTKDLILPKRSITNEFLKQEEGIVSYKDVTYYMTKKRFAELLNKMYKGTKEVTRKAGRIEGVIYEKARISKMARTSDEIIKNALSREEAVIDLQIRGLKLPSERGLTVVKAKPGRAGTFDIKEIDYKKILRLSEPAKKLTGPSIKEIISRVNKLARGYDYGFKLKGLLIGDEGSLLKVYSKVRSSLYEPKIKILKTKIKPKSELKPYEPKLDIEIGKGGQVQILKQELKLKEEGKVKVVNIKEYLKTWEKFKETVKEKLKRKQREKQEAEIITGVRIVEPFISKFKSKVETVFKTGQFIKVKAKQRLDEVNKQERRIASLIRQSDANINKQLFGQAQPQSIRQLEQQARATFQPLAQPQAEAQLEEQIIRQDQIILQDLIQERIITTPTTPTRKLKPKQPKPFKFEFELEEKVKEKVKQKAFNVFVRRRKAWSRLNKNPLDVSAAFNLGSSKVDNSAAVSFKLVMAKEKISQQLIKQSINNAFKFRAYRHKGRSIPMTPKLIEERLALKRKAVFIEDNKYRLDSPGEFKEISKGVDINKIVGGLLK